jgi:hypothetical protein
MGLIGEYRVDRGFMHIAEGWFCSSSRSVS